MWAAGGKGAVLHVRPQRRAEHLVGVEPRRPGRRRGQGDRSPRSRTAACCGRRSPRTAGRSSSSATSGSGRSTPRADRRTRCRSRCAARRPRPASSIARSPISSRSSRCRRTARRSRSSVHGEVFSASAKDGGDAARVTQTAARGGRDRLGAEQPAARLRVATASGGDASVRLRLRHRQGDAAHQRRRARRRAALLAGRQVDRVRARLEGAARRSIRRRRKRSCWRPASFDAPPFADSRDFAWSPDSRLGRVSLSAGAKAFQNVHVVAGRRRRERAPVSFLANANAGSLSWSPDGTYLTFATSQRTEPGDVDARSICCRARRSSARISSAICSARSSRRRRRRPTPPAAPAAARRCRVRRTAATRARGDRLRRHPPPRRARCRSASTSRAQEISPDGKWLLLTASAAGQQNLYVFPLDELSKEPAVARQLTSTPGAKRSAQFTADSKEVYYLDRGRRLQRHAREARAAGDRRRPPSSTSTSRARSSTCSTRRGPTCATSSSTRR